MKRWLPLIVAASVFLTIEAVAQPVQWQAVQNAINNIQSQLTTLNNKVAALSANATGVSGQPGQIVGFGTNMQGEFENVIGDGTFKRTAPNTYQLTVSSVNGKSFALPLIVANGGLGVDTLPSSGQVPIGIASGFGGGSAHYNPKTITGAGDCPTVVLSATGVLTLTCTMTNSTPFAASATVNALNATNINAGTLGVGFGGTGLASGTSGGIPYYSAAAVIASSAALTANLPVIGGGAGNPPTVGTRSGNTTSFATTTGSLPSGDLASFDASGNIVDSATKPILSGTSGSIGGSILVAGACSSGTASVTGATTSMVAEADPNTYPGDGVVWDAQVTSGGTVTVKVCAIVGLTPSASTYNIRVLQ